VFAEVPREAHEAAVPRLLHGTEPRRRMEVAQFERALRDAIERASPGAEAQQDLLESPGDGPGPILLDEAPEAPEVPETTPAPSESDDEAEGAAPASADADPVEAESPAPVDEEAPVGAREAGATAAAPSAEEPAEEPAGDEPEEPSDEDEPRPLRRPDLDALISSRRATRVEEPMPEAE
jgi:hypothetical protein